MQLLVFSVTPLKIDQNKNQIIEICVETPCWWRRHVGAHSDGHQHGGRKPTETSVTECCYKSVNLSLEEFKNINFFSNSRTAQIAKFPEISPQISHFLINSAVMQMPRHAKA